MREESPVGWWQLHSSFPGAQTYVLLIFLQTSGADGSDSDSGRDFTSVHFPRHQGAWTALSLLGGHAGLKL